MSEDYEGDESEDDVAPLEGVVLPFKRPVRWDNLRADQAQSVIRDRVREGKYDFSFHAEDRQELRDITTVDAINILKTGDVLSPPVRNEHNDWEAVVVKRMPGGRDAGAATIVFVNDDSLLIKTVMWMDKK
jgi:predicted RNA-binding protein with PUA-like domain